MHADAEAAITGVPRVSQVASRLGMFWCVFLGRPTPRRGARHLHTPQPTQVTSGQFKENNQAPEGLDQRLDGFIVVMVMMMMSFMSICRNLLFQGSATDLEDRIDVHLPKLSKLNRGKRIEITQAGLKGHEGVWRDSVGLV